MKKKRRLLQSDVFWGLAAAFLVLLQFWWLPGEDGSAADSYSTTVDGRLGLFRTLSELFPRVERDAVNVVPKRPATLLLIAPDRYPGDREQQLLYEFVYHGGNLLFAPRWNDPAVSLPSLGISVSRMEFAWEPPALNVVPSQAQGSAPPSSTRPDDTNDHAASPGQSQTDPEPVPDPAGELRETSDPDADGLKNLPLTVAPSPLNGSPVPDDPVDDGREVRATSQLVGNVTFRTNASVNVPAYFSYETLAESSSGPEAVSWMLGSGRVVVCSSADIFSNRSLLFREPRRLAVRLVEKCANHLNDETALIDPDIVISEYFNASDSYQSTGVLFSPVLRIGTLQLLLVAVLGIWMAFHRFGPAEDVTTIQRRSLTESAQAVGNLQYRLRDGGAAVRGYLEYMRSQLRRRYGSLLRLDQPDALASRAGMDPEEVRAKLKEAGMMAESTQLPAAQAAAMLRWLSKLHQRLSGSRESKNVRKTSG